MFWLGWLIVWYVPVGFFGHLYSNLSRKRVLHRMAMVIWSYHGLEFQPITTSKKSEESGRICFSCQPWKLPGSQRRDSSNFPKGCFIFFDGWICLGNFFWNLETCTSIHPQRESPIHSFTKGWRPSPAMRNWVPWFHIFFFRLMRRCVLENAMGHLILVMDCLVVYESLKRLNSCQQSCDKM